MTAGLAALALMLAGAPSPPTPFRAAVVVGVNEPFDETQPRLQYADDDAARYAEMLAGQVEHLELLTVLDAESQSVFGDVARTARVPSEAGLIAALDRVRARAESARVLGRRTELYFIYIGHGRVRGGEGEVRLLDGALDRSELTERVLRDDRFDRKHLMVDACSAYLLVNARGEGDDEVDVAFERFLQAQTLDQFPDVGAVLATSGAGPTHEWSRYQGGVFSHELRSALTGAADADGNGRVDYAEVEAFLAAANLEVPALKGRPKVFVRSPRIERGAALMQLDEGLPALELPAELVGHFVLEDGRGLRYAELHKEAGYVMSLRMVPDRAYALLSADGAQVWQNAAPVGRTRLVLPLEPIPSPRTGRGDEAPPGAFASQFGPRFMAGFTAQWQASLSSEEQLGLTAKAPVNRALRPALGITAGVIGATAVGLAVWQSQVAGDRYDAYVATYDIEERDRLADEIRGARARTTAFAVTAGIGLASGAALLLWELAAE